jgi:hypothetical protein
MTVYDTDDTRQSLYIPTKCKALVPALATRLLQLHKPGRRLTSSDSTHDSYMRPNTRLGESTCVSPTLQDPCPADKACQLQASCLEVSCYSVASWSARYVQPSTARPEQTHSATWPNKHLVTAAGRDPGAAAH